MTAAVPLIRRRDAMRLHVAFAVSAAGLLAGCDSPPPPVDYPPLRYDYLPKLRLNVASIDIDNAWRPSTVPDGLHVESLAPTHPVDALKRMAQDRLLPVGGNGHAVLTIENASLIQRMGQYEGAFAVRLDLSNTNAGSTVSGEAKASVDFTRTIVEDSPSAARAALYDVVKEMMRKMNAELEIQIRQSLAPFVPASAEVPAPAVQPVQAQPLPGAPAKPAP